MLASHYLESDMHMSGSPQQETYKNRMHARCPRLSTVPVTHLSSVPCLVPHTHTFLTLLARLDHALGRFHAWRQLSDLESGSERVRTFASMCTRACACTCLQPCASACKCSHSTLLKSSRSTGSKKALVLSSEAQQKFSDLLLSTWPCWWW